ncbi:MAG: hypothetical protein LBL45_02725 [Treponema sp.]|nr:hypothetical protein [Treponema sp.]
MFAFGSLDSRHDPRGCRHVRFYFHYLRLQRPRCGIVCTNAFILAEFAASLSWRLYCYFFDIRSNAVTTRGSLFTLIIYATVFVSMYFFERRHIERDSRLNVIRKELWSAAIIALAIFIMSDISFVTANMPFSSRLVKELFYIRTLVDFCGLVVLYTHQE